MSNTKDGSTTVVRSLLPSTALDFFQTHQTLTRVTSLEIINISLHIFLWRRTKLDTAFDQIFGCRGESTVETFSGRSRTSHGRTKLIR